jgi:hypothetical protein
VALNGYGNHQKFFGTVQLGSGKQGYNILFDDLPAGNQEVRIRRHNIMTVVQEEEEEQEHDHRSAVPDACAQINRGRKEDPMKLNILADVEWATGMQIFASSMTCRYLCFTFFWCGLDIVLSIHNVWKGAIISCGRDDKRQVEAYPRVIICKTGKHRRNL